MAKRTTDLRDTLEEEIVTGVFQPGDRLDEAALAARFGVSRTPIREALFQLAAAGLVESRARKGTFVLTIGPRRLMEMFDVMAELEALCARIAARRATAADLAQIQAAHAACEAAVSLGDREAYYYRNETFHEAIRAASRQEFLVEQANALQKRLKPYRRLQLRARDRIHNSFAEHGAIVAALTAGDAEAAAAAMRAHVAIQGERFTDLLASLEQPEALRAKG
ncbi:MAG: GntR family transcriptional regulator [Rhodospirillales bacterium]